MQILKDEIKAKILDAAVEEFLVNGYANSSLRTIAAQAGITIGNIYSYFSSKDDLFENVVAPAWEGVNDLISLDLGIYESIESTLLLTITNKICQVFIANKERFFILINCSDGSKFQNTKDNVEEFICGKIKNWLDARLGTQSTDPLFAKALASALLSGFITVFTQYGGDEDRLFKLVHELLYVLLGNIANRLK